MGRIGSFLKTLTIGGLAGFVAGLLFAPQKGEETRQQLQTAVDKGKEKFQELKNTLNKDEGCCDK